MTPHAPENGHATEPRVSFGPGRDQSVPLSWAAAMLSKLHADDPARFGRLVAFATVGERTRGGQS